MMRIRVAILMLQVAVSLAAFALTAVAPPAFATSALAAKDESIEQLIARSS